MQLRLASWACAFGLSILSATTTTSAAVSREITSLPTPRYGFSTIRVPDGRVLFFGGAEAIDTAIMPTTEVLAFIPATQSWERAGQLLLPHPNPVITLLPDGRVLVLAQDANEIFDPSTGFSSLTTPIDFKPESSATLTLADGRVLSIGSMPGVDLSANLFDLQTEVWTRLPLTESFVDNSVTIVQLLDARVMIVGGLRQLGDNVPKVEIFDPKTNVWTTASQEMNVARQDPTAVVLRDGRVLVSGGVDSQISTEIDSAEIYDPLTETWELVNTTAFKPRFGARGFLLPDGRVAIVGGFKLPITTQWPIEIFDPRSLVVEVFGELAVKRDYPEYTLLGDGRILASGGRSESATPIGNTAELIDPRARAWIHGDPPQTPRGSSAATRLENGHVLVLGGTDNGGMQLTSAEVFDPQTSSWRTLKGSMNTARAGAAIAPFDSQRVLVAGGETSDISLASAEVFDASTEQFTAIGDMHFDRSKHTAQRLLDGRILIAGGSDSGGNELDSAEIFDPATQTFVLTASMKSSHSNHAMNLLDDGRVLVTGGNSISGAELFDPQTEQWVEVGVPWGARRNQISIKLHDGRILLAGGEAFDGTVLADAWIFDPREEQWRQLPDMNDARTTSSAALLPDGRVLVLGGYFEVSGLNTAEIFDPREETWTTLPMMALRRNHPAAVPLLDGRILVVGEGQDKSDAAKSVEIFGRAIGTACDSGKECVRGVCVDGVCCSDDCLDTDVCRVCSIRWGAIEDGVCQMSSTSCNEYSCNATINAPTCKTSCLSAADCGTQYVCSLSGDCVLPETSFTREGCAAASVENHEGNAWGSIVAIGGLIIWRRSRRNKGFGAVVVHHEK